MDVPVLVFGILAVLFGGVGIVAGIMGLKYLRSTNNGSGSTSVAAAAATFLRRTHHVER